MTVFPTLYLVTDRHRTRGRDLLEVVARAIAGVPERIAVQLREKDVTARELSELASRLAVLCRACRVPLLINDRVDVALAVGADGVHLPADGMSPADARTLLARPKLIGASCHGVAETRERSGADFVVVGPVYETASKRRFGPPLGVSLLTSAVHESPLPVLAVGGITSVNVAEVARSGCAGIACIGEILEADDPTAAAKRLVAEFDSGKASAAR